jgi:hypothetical protein
VGLDSSVHADFFMVVQKFSFGEVTLISDDIAEVVANDGVEVTIEMIGEFHELLINQMSRPFMMLVNKRNCYSFTLEAQQYIYSLPDLYAVAVVAYSKVGEETAKGILNFSPPELFQSKVFADRSSALEWLLTLRKEKNLNR